jgi:hypothetical protein
MLYMKNRVNFSENHDKKKLYAGDEVMDGFRV